jgi:L-threonylcarbamoyladenylate synthase
MNRIEIINPAEPSETVLERAARLITEGEVVVCPTDTGYAFSANALDVGAIRKVFDLKGRSFSNPMHVAVISIDEVEKYAVIDESARRLAGRYLPGGLTLVLLRKEIIPDILVGGRKTVGIRIPDNPAILRLAKLTGVPITTTSANISGHPTPYSADEIIEQLGSDIEKVAMVLDQGELPGRELSTIVDLTVDPPQLLRQGKIDWAEIRGFLKDAAV